LIVMKFGGTSVADAERIAAVGRIVAARAERRPVVVVSALGGVTDLLEQAVRAARRGERELLERLLSDLQRRHRWALAGAVEDPGRRHGLSLEMDDLFEDLRQRLRSIRILGESTARASDAVLALGEDLSARIVTAVFRDRDLPARRIDPREVMLTDACHGDAQPDADAVRQRCRDRLVPLLERGDIPVIGGFVGATAQGDTTTLGRGGSDTSAALLGSIMKAEEIQIWTDVDGLMSADPRLVPAARTLPRISFAEAAELAFYGARVLHPDSIAPAVKRRIPVRVLNSLRPGGDGTLILEDGGAEGGPPLASVASRGGVSLVRIASSRLRADAGFLPEALAAMARAGQTVELVVAGEVTITLVVRGTPEIDAIQRALGKGSRIELEPDRAIICVVGSGLARSPGFRTSVLAALVGQDPEVIALGVSRTGLAAVVPQSRLEPAVRELHRQFVEGERQT
jgi:aspartate kinase